MKTQETSSSRFVRVDDMEANGTSLLAPRFSSIPQAMRGDFLSRIWSIYGKPKLIMYDGFHYTFRDQETGCVFTAYVGGSGPAYGGFRKDSERLQPVIEEFNALLDAASPVDCELQFESDYGTMKIGAKDGIPYDRMEKG